MVTKYDEKGKVFTEVISKEAIRATVQTVAQKIEGTIHVRVSERITDELDRDEPFLAMTSAKVLDQDGRTQYECDFISIRRSQIVWIIPWPRGGKDE